MLTLSLNTPHLDPVMVMCDPDQLEAWLQHLPYAQPFDCAQLIRDALAQLNCIKLPPATRLQLLRLYLLAQDKLLPVLEAEARPGDLTSYSRARNAALLAQHLSILVHNGFKRVLLDRSQEHGLFALDRHKLEALNLTMLSARQLALLYARTYTPLPAGFWHDCHQIFLYVLQQGWESKALNDKEDSLGSLYRQLLLLGLTACNRMEPALIDYTLLLIRKYAKCLHLVQIDRLPERHGAFLYQPETDSPPRFHSELPASQMPSHWWVIDTQALQHELMEKLLSLQRLAQSHNEDIQLAEEIRRVLQLMQAWQSAPQRRHTRHENLQQVELVTLLPTCWFIANQASWEFATPAEDAPPPANSTDGVEVHGAGDSNSAPAKYTRPLPAAPATVTMHNLSASGMLLRGESPQHPLRTGELAMLRLPGKLWHLAVIRWVNLRGEGMEAECGLEQLGPLPDAVMLMPVITHPNDHFQMALHLPALPRSGRPAMLVIPGRQYQKLREFRMLTAQGEQLIRTTTLDSQTAYYQFVEYRPSSDF